MRERIARAIVEGLLASDPGAFINELEANEFSRAETTIDGHFVLTAVADAVLDAMREPTKVMLDSGITAAENVEDWTQDSFTTYRVDSASDMPCPVWLAMIDAAKEER